MITPPIVLTASLKLLKIIYRPLVRKKLEGKTRLHLACGGNVVDGWANIDQYSKGEIIGWDLTEKLPVRSDTIELIYSEPAMSG